MKYSLTVYVCCLFLMLFCGHVSAYARCHKYSIQVHSQQDFDKLGTAISEQLSKGEKDIVVDFTKGNYYYKHQHLYFADKLWPETSITIRGNGATIISAGRDITKGATLSNYNEYAGFIDNAGNDYQNYSGMFQADTLVEIFDMSSKRCRIHCSQVEGLRGVDCSHAYIRLTSWFTSFLYPIDKIEDGYVYFVADNLASGYTAYGNYNVNYDHTVGKIMPRFRLININAGGNGLVSNKQGVENKTGMDLHLCETGYFIALLNCELKVLKVVGFNLIGCRGDCQFFRFRNLKAETIELSNCTMSASRGMAFYADQTDNITIKKCEFHDIYQDVINISNTCANATVRSNTFYNNGKAAINSFCVVCRGGNYVIEGNDIRDFNYGAICVGVHYRSAKGSMPSNGVVEKNHIYYTDSYIKDKANWTLVDGGAIYLCTKNDGAIIRNNFIHDYEGMGGNRGIYCDDGTNNCSVYGNIVLNINTGYGIDLRRSLTLDGLKEGMRSNVNNHIYGNVFNNRFRYQGRTDDTTSVKGQNTVLVEKGSELPNMVIDNLIEESTDRQEVYNQKKWYRKGKRLVK